jgi:hypothetical protein
MAAGRVITQASAMFLIVLHCSHDPFPAIVPATPIRMSMIRPMPFCPSLLPWKNDTPVHVSTSRARMEPGGGFLPSGAL